VTEGFIPPPWLPPSVAVPSKATIRETYERIAESFAARRERPWPEVLGFLDGLGPGDRVLDVGCGSGRHLRALASRGCIGVGIDFSRRLLSLGRSSTDPAITGSRLAWVEAEATALPFRDTVFDACLCIAVLHHLPTLEDRLRVLREIRRVLRPGGSGLVSVWALEQDRFRNLGASPDGVRLEPSGDAYIPWTLRDGSKVPRYYHLFREGELERLIIESGLHGETFFRSRGNYFARVTRHG